VCRLLRTGKYTDDSLINKCGKYSYLPGGPGQSIRIVVNYRKEFVG
jgi:hypothetical protein